MNNEKERIEALVRESHSPAPKMPEDSQFADSCISLLLTEAEVVGLATSWLAGTRISAVRHDISHFLQESEQLKLAASGNVDAKLLAEWRDEALRVDALSSLLHSAVTGSRPAD